MKDYIGRLLIDDTFQAEINNAISVSAAGVNSSSVNTVFQYSDDGSIVAVNNLRVNGLLSGQLGYLVGSLNFLYIMINDQINFLHSETKNELMECRAQLIKITVELLLNLAQVQSTKIIDSIIDKTTVQKTALKRKAGIRLSFNLIYAWLYR
jgi:hypothetical protein